MATLSPDQRNYYYLLESERTGIHQPILAALYQTHSSPSLSDGQTGLGISPANRVSLSQVNTFPEQVQYAANVIRSLTESLIAQGWQGSVLWNTFQGCYSEAFLQNLAKGYAPAATELTTAHLEACNFEQLLMRIARLVQQARDRIGRPFMITSWYPSPSINSAVAGASDSRHLIGDARDFVCEGLTGNQLYWTLDPWWIGGLARFINFPNLCHIDARSYRARWLN